MLGEDLKLLDCADMLRSFGCQRQGGDDSGKKYRSGEGRVRCLGIFGLPAREA